MKKIISIDHGNRLIKLSENHVFPSSYVESKYLPSIGGDVLNDASDNIIIDDDMRETILGGFNAFKL